VLTDGETTKLAQRVTDLLAGDTQFAAALPDKDICQTILRPGIGWSELMRVVAEGYADRPALGQRATRFVNTEGGGRLDLLPRYVTVSYRELWQRVTAVAAALSDRFVRPGDRVATLGFCSVDYTTVDMAVPLLGAVSVPLHAGAPVNQLQAMVDEVEPAVIACSAEQLGAAAALATNGRRPALVLVFDFHQEVDAHLAALRDARHRLTDAGGGVCVETLSQAIERGRRLPAPRGPEAEDERLAVIVYTSGSSGSPKGAMQPEALAKSVWTVTAGVLAQRGFAIPAITLNYMPMSHTAGRAMLYSTLGAGGTAYFAGASDMSTILADLQMVRPTQLNFVPRVWEMLYREFLSRLAKDPHISEAKVLADLRADVLGGRYVSALTGSAPIAADLAAWVERLIDSHLMNAFGATESGSVVIDGRVQRPPVTDYKLVDVPELGYFNTDKPHPRGELLIKSRTLFGGYYKRPDLTAESFDSDGYYRTGDVVAQIGPDEVQYVDRRNNVLKLSQGEFVTVSKVEAIYTNCEPVQQIFVYGNSEQAYLLAVVVPTAEALANHSLKELKTRILQSLQHAARDCGLEPFEIPREIIVEPVPFTIENGLLSGIRKPSRPNLKRHYGQRLENLYADLAAAQQTRLHELHDRAADRSVVESVCAAAGAVLGDLSDDVLPTSKFTDLGGDSLSALTLASTLEGVFAIPVPVGVIIGPASDMQSIADLIMTRRRTDLDRPTFTSVHGSTVAEVHGSTVAEVHGASVAEVHASELTLDKFIDTETLDGTCDLAPPVPDVRTVLLTGATGYLGRYLLLEWLDRMAAVDGTVICLVRAKDTAAARARLDAVFDSGDAALLARYRALAADHLEILAGDKADRGLRLEQSTWQHLADAVDLIVDSAALVNHMLPYHQLFEPNVVGTAELIRLALTVRQKPFAYVSTIGVAAIASGVLDEDADVRIAGATRVVNDTYANGYAVSKWGGEVLLREAHDLCGLPVSVFRCDMIMAEATYRGQLNAADLVTRLIFSIAATGVAPESFYARGAGGVRPRAHFDGLPVDFVAEAVSALTVDDSRNVKGFWTYHVMNPHDDGVGLDEYVDWMMQAGCRIDRISGYDDWLARFETALRNLPERQRNASLLPLLVSFHHPQPALSGAFAPTQRFRKAVAEAEIGIGGAIPVIDRRIIEKYISDLELLGLLDPSVRGLACDDEKEK
jgi:fatty acid CoA ligase FadD9